MQNDLISRSERLRQIRQTEPADCGSAMLISDAKKMIRAFIEEAPAVDAVSRSVFEQIKWERDCAMQQLKDHGIPFGGIAPAVDAREEMIELLLSGDKTVQCEHSQEVNCDGTKCAFCERVEIADRLIANGVTFAKDTNVPSKWISAEPLGADDE